MLNSQLIAQRIKQQVKNNGSTVKQLCGDLEIGINALSRLASGEKMSYQTFTQIADYLDCSVDYLLGREKPCKVLTETEESLINAFRKLSPVEQGQVIGFTLGLANKP